MKLWFIGIGLGIIFSLQSCVHELELPAVNNYSQVTIVGELIAGRPMGFRVGQTVPINQQNTLQFQILQGLTVTGTDNFQNQYTFQSRVDTFTNLLFTLPYTHPNSAYPGATYTITTTHPKLSPVKALVYIPESFTCKLLDTVTVNNSVKKMMRFRFEISDDGGKENYYTLEALKQIWQVQYSFYYQGAWQKIETNRPLFDSLEAAGVTIQKKADTTRQQNFVRMPVYTDDVNSDNLSLGNPLSVNKRILLPDKNFQGNSRYHTNLYVESAMFFSSSAAQKGSVVILVKSVAKEYYTFLKSYEQYDAQQGLNSFNKPIKIEGNILGGAGMLGGVYLHQFDYCFDEWEIQ